jgi:two-component system sensor histidine kinase DctS
MALSDASLSSATFGRDAPPWRRRWRRGLLWGVLAALLVAVEFSLLWLTWQHERNRLQEALEQAAAASAADMRQRLVESAQGLQQLFWVAPGDAAFRVRAADLLRARPEVVRLEWRDDRFAVQAWLQSPLHPSQFNTLPREAMTADAEAACAAAHRFSAPMFSRSFFMPTQGGLGGEVVDLCVPVIEEGRARGSLVATLRLSDVLEQAVAPDLKRQHEVLLVEADGTRLARAGLGRGRGVYRAERLVDVDGFTALLRLDSTADRPALIPNVSSALVLGLSIALCAVVLMLAHDVRRRAIAERGLAESLAFRKAMEDSLVTGLRARDLSGAITYVNPAFCHMVGWSAAELRASPEPLYWPPELAETYRQRQAVRLAGNAPPREGYETTFMRRDGARIPVLIFEAPLVDGRGGQTGWMSAVLDMSDQRRVEELSRQQQDKLQAAARLATMGEMATLLSHELNQPLAAIASYAGGSLNLLPDAADAPAADLETQLMIRQAMVRVAEQAERAGRVIRSVHQFVRRRDRLRENVRAHELIEAVLPLVRLAARRGQVHVEVEVPDPPPRVSCDRTMVEQVLLNLARNAIQAMDGDTAAEDRLLRLRVRPRDERWVEFAVVDRGPGITDAVAEQLFTPFFTTKAEGMGIGLSMCRTVVEQHGGALDFVPTPGGRGATFRFTLAVAGPALTVTSPPNAEPALP